MKLGVQLYTLRDFITTRDGFAQTLDRIAAMGYDGVQISAVGCMDGDSPEVSASDAAQMLKERNLLGPATHRGWNQLGENTDAEITFHKELGATVAAIPVPPDGVHDLGTAAYREWLGKAKGVADKLKAQGITLSYHNHAMEFQRFGEKGERPYDVMIEEAPWLAMELDTYWVHHSGSDLLATIKRLKGRLPTVHLKDIAPFGWEVSFAPVGEGNLNWPVILEEFKNAGTEWMFVEQDTCRRDPFDCVESSFKYLKSVLG